MADILQEIVAHKQVEVAQWKQEVAPTMLYRQVEAILDFSAPSMSKVLSESGSGIIAEFKRKQHGAAALSILTDKHYFGGEDEFIRIARHQGVKIPILYKNFVIDEYQLFQARLCGVSAVLLIAACLTKEDCRALQQTAHELGMEVLLEMHSEEELEYAEQEPDLCGINNRHLGSFVTDVETSFRLAAYLPKEAVKVSESGLSDPLTVKQLRSAGFRGFLMGEHFMKSADPGKALAAFIQQL